MFDQGKRSARIGAEEGVIGGLHRLVGGLCCGASGVCDAHAAGAAVVRVCAAFNEPLRFEYAQHLRHHHGVGARHLRQISLCGPDLPGSQSCFVFAARDDEQEFLFQWTLLTRGAEVSTEFMVVDFDDTFGEVLESTPLPPNFSVVTSKSDASQLVAGIVGYLSLGRQKVRGVHQVLVIANLADFIAVTGVKPDDFVLALKNTFKWGLDFVIFSRHDYLSRSFDPVPKLLREVKFAGLVGARAYDSSLVKSTGVSSESESSIDEPFFVLRGGSTFEKIKLPQSDGVVA